MALPDCNKCGRFLKITTNAKLAMFPQVATNIKLVLRYRIATNIKFSMALPDCYRFLEIWRTWVLPWDIPLTSWVLDHAPP